MELIPTQDEVIALLRRTGGIRKGHFEYSNGAHVSEYVQVSLTMCDFNDSNILSVALSRKLRSNSDIRALLPKVSVVAPATGGLPVAYGVSEALRAQRVPRCRDAQREVPRTGVSPLRRFNEKQPALRRLFPFLMRGDTGCGDDWRKRSAGISFGSSGTYRSESQLEDLEQ